MALPEYEMLGELRPKLARRLGYRADPAAADGEWLADLLRLAQTQLWEDVSAWTRVVQDFPIETEAGKYAYAWPERCDPDRVQYVYCRYTTDQVLELIEGFSAVEYDLRDDYSTWPKKYRRRAELEVWPTPDDAYTLIVGAQQRLGAFSVDTDRATVPDDMVLMQAIIFGREDQGRTPPIEIMRRLAKRIGQLRARSHPQHYLPPQAGGRTRGLALPEPQIGGPPTYQQ